MATSISGLAGGGSRRHKKIRQSALKQRGAVRVGKTASHARTESPGVSVAKKSKAALTALRSGDCDRALPIIRSADKDLYAMRHAAGPRESKAYAKAVAMFNKAAIAAKKFCTRKAGKRSTR